MANGRLEVHQVPVWQDNLVWLVVCTQTGEAGVIDGPEAEPVLNYCQKHGIRLTSILNTHTHGDHIGINRSLAKQGRLDEFSVIGCVHRRDDIPGLTHPVDEGDVVSIGNVDGVVWLTEGHIDGHVSFIFDDALFCGDTLFGAGCGYLFDGPAHKMHDSLTRFMSLPESTWVFCAHEYTQDNLKFAWSVEPENRELRERIKSVWAMRARGQSVVPSTIGLERQTNPFVRTQSEQIRRLIAHSTGKDLSGASAFAWLRALKDSKAYRSISDENFPVDLNSS